MQRKDTNTANRTPIGLIRWSHTASKQVGNPWRRCSLVLHKLGPLEGQRQCWRSESQHGCSFVTPRNRLCGRRHQQQQQQQQAPWSCASGATVLSQPESKTALNIEPIIGRAQHAGPLRALVQIPRGRVDPNRPSPGKRQAIVFTYVRAEIAAARQTSERETQTTSTFLNHGSPIRIPGAPLGHLFAGSGRGERGALRSDQPFGGPAPSSRWPPRACLPRGAAATPRARCTSGTGRGIPSGTISCCRIWWA